MTKSNIRSVRRRQTNRRLGQHFDQHNQLRVRAYDGQRNERLLGEYKRVSRARALIDRIKRFFSNLGRRFFSASTIRGLDLRQSDAARFGAFRPNRARDAGAAVLRSWFGPNLKMRSTRDGKPV